jgi:formate-dependent nitrite reductase membrane component NrfD
MMVAERQNTFGGLIAIDLFLGGAGAGMFFISFVMDLVNKFESIARIGCILGPILVIGGTLVLFLDLGNKSGLYRIFINPSSWVTRGTYFITLFVLFGLAYSLPAFGPFSWIPWGKATILGKALGWAAVIFSFLTMLYTGFLLGTTKRIPLWNTPALPLLFFFSSLYTGMASLLVMGYLFMPTPGEDFHTLVLIEIVLILTQLLVLGLFLWTGSYGSTTAVESVHLLLKKRLFSIGVVITGLIIPLGLLIYYASLGNGFFVPTLAGLLLLASGLFLRYCILRAGLRLPLYSV